jgi:hypothetical protein
MFIRTALRPTNIYQTLLCACALFLFCSPMEPLAPFERIESGRIRPVGMVIDPYPEGAPGDVLRVSAYFAGKPIVKYTDFRVCKGEFDTVGTPVSISGPIREGSDEIVFEYRLPDTILDSVLNKLRASPGYVPEFDTLLSALSPKIIMLPQDTVTDSAWSHQAQGFILWHQALPLDSSQMAAALGFFNELYLKCRFMFTASTADGESLKIRKDFMVRYNDRFGIIPDLSKRLPVNHNPEILSLILHKVAGDTSEFDPAEPSPPFTDQYMLSLGSGNRAITDTVEIDTGYSYFFEVRTSKGDTYHISYPLKNDPKKFRDSLVSEKYWNTWFFEQIGGTLPPEDGMTLQQDEHENIIKFYPSLDPGASGCTIWVKISDYLESKTPRPTGTAQASARCVFRYTDAYKKSMGW